MGCFYSTQYHEHQPIPVSQQEPDTVPESIEVETSNNVLSQQCIPKMIPFSTKYQVMDTKTYYCEEEE